MTNYIISSCEITAFGITSLIGESVKTKVLDIHKIYLYPIKKIIDDNSVLIVYIPKIPFWMFLTLQKIVYILNSTRMSATLLILTNINHEWIENMIRNQVDSINLKSVLIKIIPVDSSLKALSSILRSETVDEYLCSINKKASTPSLYNLTGGKNTILSKTESRVIIDFLSECSINEQAKLYNVSIKTLYNQRNAAIKKLNHISPFLHNPSVKPKEPRKKIIVPDDIPPFDHDFANALYSDELFIVLQPILELNRFIKGFELLIRWARHNKTIEPVEFLPKLSTTFSWIILTAFVTNHAVKLVNRYRGQYFFSVNIHHSIIKNNGFIKIFEKAMEQLKNKSWTKHIHLEIDEYNNIYNDPQAIKNIEYLQGLGFTFSLDDCFSDRSAPFPVNKIKFDVYKLDSSVVCKIDSDEESLALIKSLNYYCSLTNRICIAEGVSNANIYKELVNNKINFHQGFFISPPFKEECLQGYIDSKKIEICN
ncbi:EAL domain-containing protein [Klebsiella pneumoniae]|uniref:EAL domain-containing protein n=1 Tax=Klebsiella pneumoniae TaxID=573 RepID=UPI00237FF06D|nr:EAL domain-containing protein [Klebsiella pneumoniae]MDE4802397.1 EAL domain-containing protein [Klebsiella pneumoniae]MDE4821973.1 EAL domain-containing protein [Klebsiella pneumoniae]